MPRPIWKGQISFGLVTIPVVLYSAEEPSDGVQFHFVDRHNHARIKNQRVNEKTGKPVAWEDIERGFELEDGSHITFSDSDLDHLEVEANQSVEITDFVSAADISLAYFNKPYFLVPEKRGRKGYVILRDALKKAKKVGIAKVVIRTRQYLSALSPDGDSMMLYLLRYEYELRKPKEEDLPGSLKELGITPNEMKMAEQLVNSMTTEWQPHQYKDEYRERLMKWVKERSKKGGTKAPAAEKDPKGGEVIDIMSLLKASMAKAKTSEAKPPARRKKA